MCKYREYFFLSFSSVLDELWMQGMHSLPPPSTASVCLCGHTVIAAFKAHLFVLSRVGSGPSGGVAGRHAVGFTKPLQIKCPAVRPSDPGAVGIGDLKEMRERETRGC